MMEPTACELHAGCLGNINATWTFHGRSGHSARPWTADNAIERAAAGVLALAAQPPLAARVRRARVRRGRERDEDRGRHRRQRDPGPRECHVNFRYAPGRGAAEAEARLAELCAGHGELRIDSNAPSGAVATGPRVDALVAAGRPRARAQAGVDAGGGVRRSPGLPAVNFGPGDPAQAHRRDESVEIARSCAPTRCWSGSRRMRPPPRSPACGRTRSCASTEAKRRLQARRRRPDRLRHRRAARGDARVHPRGARRGARAALHLPAADGLPELRAAIAAGRAALRRGARPRHAGAADARLEGGDLPPRAGARRRPGRGPAPAYPVYERGAVFAGKRGARAAAARGRAASCPTSTPSTRTRGATSRCCGSTTRTTRPRRPRRSPLYERAAALAREHGFVVASDEAYSEIYFGGEPPASALAARRPHRRRGLQHALQALLDAGLPLGLRRRRPGADRAAQALPAERRRRAAGVRPARGARRVGATRRTSSRCAPATAPSATCCCRCSRRAGCATRAATRRSSSGSTPARAPTLLADAAARGGIIVLARLVLRGRRRRLPAARARADARRVRARRPAARRCPLCRTAGDYGRSAARRGRWPPPGGGRGLGSPSALSLRSRP